MSTLDIPVILGSLEELMLGDGEFGAGFTHKTVGDLKSGFHCYNFFLSTERKIFRQLKAAIKFKEWNKCVVGAGSVNPSRLGLHVSERSSAQATYIVYKSPTGPDVIPVHMMIIGLVTGGNFVNGTTVRKAQGEFGVGKSMYLFTSTLRLLIKHN